MDYWIVLLSVPIFVGTYLYLTRATFSKAKGLLSLFPLAIVSFFSLFNFLPQFPHGGFVWIIAYCLASFFSSWIRYTPVRKEYIKDVSISELARIERVKESITLWRTISLSMGFGYMALWIPWAVSLWNIYPKMIVTDRSEMLLVALVGAFQLATFSIYMICGPIIECFSKTRAVADMLLLIKTENCLEDN